MKVARWGNSLALRLPAAVVEALALKEGDDVQVDVADAAHLTVARSPTGPSCWPGCANTGG